MEHRRTDCPPDKTTDCPKCGLPIPSPGVTAIISLYNRCKDMRALPEQGGLLDQPQYILNQFDVIMEETIAFKRQMEERAILERQKEELERGLPRGRR